METSISYKTLLLLLILFSCSDKKVKSSSFVVELKQTNEYETRLDLVFYGPLDIYWYDEVMTFEYFEKNDDSIEIIDIFKLDLYRNQLVLENRKGEMRVFSDIPDNIPFEVNSYYTENLSKEKISLNKNEKKSMTLILPYLKKHFAFNKKSVGDKIRLHYIYIPSLNESKLGMKKTIITSNWIDFKNIE